MAGGTPTTYSDLIEQSEPFGILFGGESRAVNVLFLFHCPVKVGDSQISSGARMETEGFFLAPRSVLAQKGSWDNLNF